MSLVLGLASLRCHLIIWLEMKREYKSGLCKRGIKEIMGYHVRSHPALGAGHQGRD